MMSAGSLGSSSLLRSGKTERFCHFFRENILELVRKRENTRVTYSYSSSSCEFIALGWVLVG